MNEPGLARDEIQAGPLQARTAATTKFGYLESLRTIAACIVVVTHFIGAFRPCLLFGRETECPAVLTWEPMLWSSPANLLLAGQAAVAFFFVLSGYVLSLPFFGPRRDRYDLVGALVKRPLRLAGLVLATELIALALWFHGGFDNGAVSAAIGGNAWFGKYWSWDPRAGLDLPWSLFTVPLQHSANVFNPPLWTITVEVYGSIMVFGFLLLMRGSRLRIPLGVAGLLLTARTPYIGFWIGLLFAEATHRQWLTPATLRSPAAIALLAIGVWLYAFPWYLPPERVAQTFWWWMPALPFYGGATTVGATLVFAAFVANQRLQRSLSMPWLVASGAYSYALYAVHFVVLGSIASRVYLAWADRIGTTGALAAALFVYLLLVGLSAFVLGRLVDRPVTRAANALGASVARGMRALAQPRT